MMTLYWPPVPVVLLAPHVLANVVWIGALLSESVLLGRAIWVPDPTEIGALARRVHTRLAIPAFLASFAAGLAPLFPARGAYAGVPWVVGKVCLGVPRTA